MTYARAVMGAMGTLGRVMVVVALAGCGSPPLPAAAPAAAPRRGPAGAPADARLVFRTGGGALLGRPGGVSVAKQAIVATLEKACRVDLARAVSGVEGFVTDAGAVRVEVAGTLSVREAACLAEAAGLEDVPVVAADAARVELAGVVLTRREGGGVVVATRGMPPERAGGAASALLDRVAALEGDVVVAARTQTGVVDASLRLGERDAILRFGAPAEAASLARALEQGIARARAANDPALAGAMVSSSRGGVELAFEPGLETAAALRKYVVEAVKVPSGSMEPTLSAGDHLFVLQDSSPPARGEVVRFEMGRGQTFVKRVVAVAGDRVRLEKDRLVLNGEPVKRTRAGEVTLPSPSPDEPALHGTAYDEELGGSAHRIVVTEGAGDFGADMPEVVVPAGHVFLLGDNRRNSHDSRELGPIANDKLRGKAAIVWLPASGWDRFLAPVR